VPCEGQGRAFRQTAYLTVHQRHEALQRLSEGVSQADLARSYGVLQATIGRLASPLPFEVGAAL
jgi:hypothetical protein